MAELRSWSHAQPRAQRDGYKLTAQLPFFTSLQHGPQTKDGAAHFQAVSSHNNENYQDNPDLHSPSLRLSLGDSNLCPVGNERETS